MYSNPLEVYCWISEKYTVWGHIFARNYVYSLPTISPCSGDIAPIRYTSTIEAHQNIWYFAPLLQQTRAQPFKVLKVDFRLVLLYQAEEKEDFLWINEASLFVSPLLHLCYGFINFLSAKNNARNIYRFLQLVFVWRGSTSEKGPIKYVMTEKEGQLGS
jgi:hypothetical protein